MEQTDFLLCKAISASLTDKTEVLPDCREETVKKLLRLAADNHIFSLVLAGMKKLHLPFSPETEKECEYYEMRDLTACANMDVALETVRRFEEEKIPFLPLKGAVLRELYPDPLWRIGCDADILVRERDLEKCCHILEENGFERTQSGSKDICFSSGGINLELHYRLFEDDTNSRAFGDIFSRLSPADGKQYEKRMSDTDFTAFLTAHTAKHFLFSGIGIRAAVDMAVCRKKLSPCREELMSLLEKMGLRTFFEVFENVSRAVLGEKEPNETEEKVIEYMISGGIFGNRERYVTVQGRNSGGKLGYLFSRIFLPLERMKNRYPVLRKAPVLLPFFWILRAFRFFGKGHGRLQREFQTRNDLEVGTFSEVSRLYSELGL